ncbi:DUF5996 family protein [soil metagenome]
MYMDGQNEELFPPLPLEEWEETKNTLHRFTQIIGKIRLRLAPFQNHWWHVPLSVSATGLRTGPMPYQDTTFEIELDFVDHFVLITTSYGQMVEFSLHDGLTVAEFYQQTFECLDELGIHIEIHARPFDLAVAEPFETDTIHASYDPEFVNRYWRILTQVDGVLKEFAGRFSGKSSPVHLYWHSFDLAVTRFSGRRAPERPDADPVTREAYSHEVISFGFWPGDAKVRAPAFYSYTAPEPAGLADQPLQPDAAHWNVTNGSSMALLMYNDLRQMESPKAALLNFLESAYQAGARLADWDIEALRSNTPY